MTGTDVRYDDQFRVQDEVVELVRMLDFRDELAMHARGVAETRLDPEPFLNWAEGEPWLAERRSPNRG